MARPGVEIVSRAAPPSRGVPTDTGVWFVVGLAERGRTDAPVMVRNMADYTKHFGDRVSYSLLYDAVDTFFREGGSQVYIARVAGPAATVDTITLNDAGAAPSIAVDSIGPGATNLSVDVDAGNGADTFVLKVYLDGIEVERSGDLADPAAAVNWARDSVYIRVRALGVNDPAPTGAAVDLAGGADDRAAITDAERVAALDIFSRNYGPGQVSIPGATTTDAHVGLLDHAKAFNRVALLDAPDSSSDATVVAAADAIRASSQLDPDAVERGALFAPWAVVPGVVRGTTRAVPPSAVAAGLMARSDALTGNPNVPAAGANGESRFALELTQPEWTDTVRQTLNGEGVNVFRTVYGGLRLYAYRTLSLNAAWQSLAAARVRMAIENSANLIGEQFLFAQIDGRGHKLAEFSGALTGMLAGYWASGALYGETADEAFIVDTGAAVNTPDTLSNNELRAVIGLRTSPFAELVYIEIVKVPITEAL